MTTKTTLQNIQDAITALKDGWARTALNILEEARLDEMAKEQLMQAGIYPPGTGVAAQPALKPLTDVQRIQMWHKAKPAHVSWASFDWYSQGIADTEAAHGIKGDA